MSAKPRPDKGVNYKGGHVTSTGQKLSIKDQKVRRKRSILKRMVHEGAGRYELMSKANFMALSPKEYADILAEAKDEEKASYKRDDAL